jgi:hypothetical protein
MRPKHRTAARSIVVSLVALAAAPAAGWALPTILNNSSVRHPFSVRPASIGYTGDGTGVIGGFDGTGKRDEAGQTSWGHIHWTSWAARSATGSGALWADDCEPDCAEGSFSPVAVQVHAFAPHHGHFTLLLLQYELEGKSYVDERRVKYIHEGRGFYEYFIVRQTAEQSSLR